MKEINIGKNLAQMRREKGITQDELAQYFDVSKAAVSKWETGTSYPDIALLPQLAAYFNISVDELLGYQPQMTKEDIRKLYHQLAVDFAEKPYDEVMEKCEKIIRKYFSCYSLLVQMGALFLNHAHLAKDPQSLILRVVKLCEKIRNECQDVWIEKEALLIETQAYLVLREPQKVIDLIGETIRPITHETESLAIAYQMQGNKEKSNQILQICMFQHLCSLLGDAITYIAGYGENPKQIEQTIEWAMKVAEIFDIEKLHVNTAFNIYMASAQFYAYMGKMQEALSMLEKYVECCVGINFPLTLGGNDYFDKIDSWIEEFELGKDSPMNALIIKEALIQGMVENPFFKELEQDKRYQELAGQLKINLEGK